MKEVQVYNVLLLVCAFSLVIAALQQNWFACVGFGLAIIGFAGSRWFYVRWDKAGRPQDDNSII